MNQDPSRAPVDDWDDPGSVPEADPPPKSFFTPLRCCGCLTIGTVIVGILGYWGFNKAIDMIFPQTPIEVPVVDSTPTERGEIEVRVRDMIDSGGTVTITPREFTVLLDSAIQGSPFWTEDSAHFHCAPTEDGYLRMLFSAQFVEDAAIVGGRYLNMEFIGTLTVENGEVTAADVAYFKVGSSEDENAGPEKSKEFFDKLFDNPQAPPEWRTQVENVELFRFDGEKIELRLRDTGRNGGSPGGVTTETPTEVPAETGGTGTGDGSEATGDAATPTGDPGDADSSGGGGGR